MRTLAVSFVLACTISTAQAATLHVPSEYSTIQAAIDAAMDGDIVQVGPGNYPEHLVFGTHSITLISTDGRDVTFVTAITYGEHVVQFPYGAGNNSLIEGFTIRYAVAASGVMIHPGNSPTIRFCHFTANSGFDGAGILCLGNGVIVYGCRFTDNECNDLKYDEGAGIYIRANDVTIDSCYFAQNDANSGSAGAIYMQFSSNIWITRNLGVNNRAGSWGGGFLYAYICNDIHIINNTVVGNFVSSSHGSGITMRADTGVVLHNNIFAYNGSATAVWASTSTVDSDCNAAFGNLGGDYFGVNPGPGSFHEEPHFCGFFSGEEDFQLQPYSKCAPQNNSCNVLIGAFGVSLDCTDYVCGDADDNGHLDLYDLFFLRDAYFQKGPLPRQFRTGDPNCDGLLMIDDIIYHANYWFGRGPAPCCDYSLDNTTQAAPRWPEIKLQRKDSSVVGAASPPE